MRAIQSVPISASRKQRHSELFFHLVAEAATAPPSEHHLHLNSAGFTISLDDFGSQYSNLAILAAMDFDEIKFDKSLVKTLEQNRKSQVVMENSVRMCRDLDGTYSLAEGIETKGQLDLLLDYKCDYGQGYYFSKPVPPEEFQKLLGKLEL